MNEPGRAQRSVEELKAASEHLWYEGWMFMSLAKLLAMRPFGPGIVTNGLLEAFTVHGRLLLHFLYPRNPRPDDVLAAHYCASAEEWEGLRGAMPNELADLDRRVGKEVAHLTYARLSVTPEEKVWRFLAIAAAMQAVLRTWANSADHQLLAPMWFEGEVDGQPDV